jgi:hypothetical protein
MTEELSILFSRNKVASTKPWKNARNKHSRTGASEASLGLACLTKNILANIQDDEWRFYIGDMLKSAPPRRSPVLGNLARLANSCQVLSRRDDACHGSRRQLAQVGSPTGSTTCDKLWTPPPATCPMSPWAAGSAYARQHPNASAASLGLACLTKEPWRRKGRWAPCGRPHPADARAVFLRNVSTQRLDQMTPLAVAEMSF